MQVDFYILSSSDEHARSLFICRLVEKIYRQGHRVYIHCKDRQETHHLDELLWTFSDTSFIPHHLYEEGPDTPAPIQLGFDSTPKHKDVLINLCVTIPLFYTSFQRILEIVSNTEEKQAISKEHEQFYQSQKIEIKTHQLSH